MVFTANAALIWRGRACLARFRHAARQPETTVDAAWFQAAGFETRELPLGWDWTSSSKPAAVQSDSRCDWMGRMPRTGPEMPPAK
ncbi:MAG: hypothetical protein DWI21_03790 [Planctomycetota bacterium]|nr:MAG: hypothetical protein DWI21_03790 [Planctomycetota bacterium]